MVKTFKKQIIPQTSYEKQIRDLKFIHKYFFTNNLQIKENKINMKKFLNFYKFAIIYFFIGNFFIQNKLYKTLKNVIKVNENFVKISKPMSQTKEDLYEFIYKIKKQNNLNIKNILFLYNLNFYMPKTILDNHYFYFTTLYIYTRNIKIIINFLNIYMLKIMFILNNNCSLTDKNNTNRL